MPADPDYLPRTEVNDVSRFEKEELQAGQLIVKEGSLEVEVPIRRQKENPRKADLETPPVCPHRTLAWMCLLSGPW